LLSLQKLVDHVFSTQWGTIAGWTVSRAGLEAVEDIPFAGIDRIPNMMKSLQWLDFQI
jgi:hypothetical protein